MNDETRLLCILNKEMEILNKATCDCSVIYNKITKHFRDRKKQLTQYGKLDFFSISSS